MKLKSKTVKSKKSTRKQTLKGGWAQHGSNARFPTGTTSVTTHNNIQTSGATSNAKPKYLEHTPIEIPMTKPYIPPQQPEPEKPTHGLGYIDAGIHLPTPRDLKDVKVVHGKSDMVYPSAASQNDVTQYPLSRKQNFNNFGWAIRDINSLNGKKSKKSVKKSNRKNKLSYLENSVRNMF